MLVESNLKTKYRMKKAIVFLFVAVAIIPSCKKGANDPFISFHSRKARVAGEWKVSSYDLAANNLSTPPSGSATVFVSSDKHDGTAWTGSSTKTIGSGSPDKHNYAGTVTTHSYSFAKDGTWSSKLDYSISETVTETGQTTKTTIHKVITSSGSWDFLNGIPSEYKKKEAMSVCTLKEDISVTTIAEVTLSGSTIPYYTQTNVDNTSDTYALNENVMVWKLTELKNKELMAEINQDNSSSGTDSQTSVSGSSTNVTNSTKTSYKNTVTGKITLKQ